MATVGFTQGRSGAQGSFKRTPNSKALIKPYLFSDREGLVSSFESPLGDGEAGDVVCDIINDSDDLTSSSSLASLSHSSRHSASPPSPPQNPLAQEFS